jgi:hypothetical protein
VPNKEHVAAALKGSLVRVPEVQIRSPLNEPLPTKSRTYTTWVKSWNSSVSRKNVDLLKKAGLAIMPESQPAYTEQIEQFYVVPDSVKVAAGNQTRLIAIVLQTRWREPLLRQPQGLALAAETFRLLAHLLGYLVLLFGVGAIYRRFALSTIGSAGEAGLAESPWGIRWRQFQVRAHRLLDRFQTPRSKFVVSASVLLAGVVLVAFGLFSFVRAPGSVLRHGVPIGLILILLVPTDGLLRRSWAPRFRIAQGILLQVGGLYALTGLFYLFFFSGEDWGPGLLLVQHRRLLALAGIGLVILGQRKRELTAAETLALQPNQAPVLHLRSLEIERQNRRETWVSWIRRFLKPNDEQILRPIFGALGPFATFAYSENYVTELSQSDQTRTTSGQTTGAATGTRDGKSTIV